MESWLGLFVPEDPFMPTSVQEQRRALSLHGIGVMAYPHPGCEGPSDSSLPRKDAIPAMDIYNHSHSDVDDA